MSTAFTLWKIVVSYFSHLEPLVRQCCRHCIYLIKELVEVEDEPDYMSGRCLKYREMNNAFPQWNNFNRELICCVDVDNQCQNYKQKELSSAPLFEATSA